MLIQLNIKVWFIKFKKSFSNIKEKHCPTIDLTKRYEELPLTIINTWFQIIENNTKAKLNKRLKKNVMKIFKSQQQGRYKRKQNCEDSFKKNWKIVCYEKANKKAEKNKAAKLCGHRTT